MSNKQECIHDQKDVILPAAKCAVTKHMLASW